MRVHVDYFLKKRKMAVLNAIHKLSLFKPVFISCILISYSSFSVFTQEDTLWIQIAQWWYVSALYIKPSFLAKIVLKLFSILSFWTRKVDLQSFTKEWKNWQKCKLDFHVRNAQYKDLPYCFSTLYSKKQWPIKLSNYYCSNLSLLPFWQDH